MLYIINTLLLWLSWSFALHMAGTWYNSLDNHLLLLFNSEDGGVYWSWLFTCFMKVQIYSGWGSSMYVYCMVCQRVIAAPYVWSFVVPFQTIRLLIMIRNAKWTMSSLYGLKFFPHQDTGLPCLKCKIIGDQHHSSLLLHYSSLSCTGLLYR